MTGLPGKKLVVVWQVLIGTVLSWWYMAADDNGLILAPAEGEAQTSELLSHSKWETVFGVAFSGVQGFSASPGINLGALF